MYEQTPFGNPDGSRTEIDDMMNDFVVFKGKFFSSGVAFPDETKCRVIVGAKGSGKTVYLRRLHAKLSQNAAIYTTDINQEVPETDLIIQFSQLFSEKELTEKWMILWKMAIIRSVISYLLCNDVWAENVSAEEKELLKKYETKIYPSYNVSMPIYAEARHILVEYNTRNLFNQYAQKHEWDELEIIIGRIIRNLAPIYFFIDSIDEEYGHAPMYWLRCQKGLFYRIMRMIRKEIYGNKLHVIIAIRDSVMASIYQGSEHNTRYINEDHIKNLNWDYSTIEYFLDKKIEKLKNCYFIIEGNEKNIENWFGINKIHNSKRDIEEDLQKYILRHTRLLPRDVVIIGNELSEIKRKKVGNPSLDIQKEIRKKVANCAKIFGDELINICANQINNNAMPKGAAKKEYSEVYTSIEEYKESTSSIIKQALLQLESDKITWTKIKKIEDEVNVKLDNESHLFDVLWQNGGIGYIEAWGPNGDKEVFFNSRYPQLLLPENKDRYILRSCLIDAVGIFSDKWDKTPVIGGELD